MKVLLRLMLVIVMALAPATVVNAQSASAKYDEGMALYNKGKKAKAIKAFQASMVLDKSAENKARCNAMIQKCKARPRPSRDDYPKPKPVSNLSLGSERLEFDGKKVEADVVSVYGTSNWKATVEDSKDAAWCLLEPETDMKGLKVKTEMSPITVSRTATIVITDENEGGISKKVTVVQSAGRIPRIYVDPTEFLRIDKKGDEKVFVVDCVSDTLYSDGKNWRVKSCSEWVTILPDKQKAAGGLLGKLGKKDKDKREPLEKNELCIKVEPNTSGRERAGGVTLVSQNQEFQIKLKQKK